MKSCLYEGFVRHRRRLPLAHDFHYRLFLVYLDLAELDQVFRGRWLWSTRRPALARFDRGDHLGDPARSLDEAVRDVVERQAGTRPRGPIRLLTHLRYLGFVFNPVSFYYCFAADGERLEAVVAEVDNTPWGERHLYVLPEATSRALGPGRRWVFPKTFHVSPFIGMDVLYDWRFTVPGRRLVVHTENLEGGKSAFDATLVLGRREIAGPSLASALLRYPLLSARVVAAIYWQAARLWLRGAPFHTHPAKLAARTNP